MKGEHLKLIKMKDITEKKTQYKGKINRHDCMKIKDKYFAKDVRDKLQRRDANTTIHKSYIFKKSILRIYKNSWNSPRKGNTTEKWVHNMNNQPIGLKI
jgi:hypothetical protein